MSNAGYESNSFYSDKFKVYGPGTRARRLRDLKDPSKKQRADQRYKSYQRIRKVQASAKKILRK